jgi:uncharacterized membrane protein YfcA
MEVLLSGASMQILLSPPSMAGIFFLKSLYVYYYMLFGKKIFCIPCVKRNAEQKTSPRATLSEAKLELKRIVFCGSIPFYKLHANGFLKLHLSNAFC